MKKTVLINGHEVEFELIELKSGSVQLRWGQETLHYTLIAQHDDMLVLKDQHDQVVRVRRNCFDQQTLISGGGVDAMISEKSASMTKNAAVAGGLNSPMPGKIFKVTAVEGDKVTKGQTILILEAMKMEHAIKADKDGILKKIFFKVGEQVQGGVALAEISA